MRVVVLWCAYGEIVETFAIVDLNIPRGFAKEVRSDMKIEVRKVESIKATGRDATG
ncbi:hypothetical protein [Actinomadura roseirufa]|uniref:hypothetical protein n=1 Tax=Actinomadura roseirufa TaxID=2094049 RepID=UPI0013F1552A|nr:hypothetical protein [Actinomadura roseirufa]